MNNLINISDLATVIEGNFPEIPFAHIFGSSADGVVKAGSDIDIAIWYNGTDPFLKVKVLEAIEPLVKNIPVDIVNICNADPLLAHEALAGNVLFVREEQKSHYASFYSKIVATFAW